jgi:hypothetical protein
MNRAQSVVYDVDAVPVTLFEWTYSLQAVATGLWHYSPLTQGFTCSFVPRFPRLRFVTGIPIPMAVRCTFLCVP